MKAKIYEWILRSFIRLPHSILETIFTIFYPIYAMLHTEKAWKRVLLHLRHAGFPKKKVAVRGVFKALFFNMIDSLRFLDGAKKIKPIVYYENESVLTNCIKEGLPIVAMGIHQGAFEIQHRSLLRYSKKVHLFTESLKDKDLNTALRSIRKCEGLEEHDTFEVGKVLKQFIREKSILAIAVDQSKTAKGNPVTLFGQKSNLFLRLPAKACQMGAAIVTFRTFHIGGNEHVVRFESIYGPGTSAQEIAKSFAEEMESWIQEHPRQWTWNYHRNFT
jgi:KDO2-lipid IV(A) lauroyltransferase